MTTLETQEALALVGRGQTNQGTTGHAVELKIVAGPSMRMAVAPDWPHHTTAGRTISADSCLSLKNPKRTGSWRFLHVSAQ
jgi:hypothetical protein